MSERHVALIVEDDGPTAEELAAVLGSLDYDVVVIDNKIEVLAAIKKESYCLVLLDLQIKAGPDSIKGHVQYGSSLLREIRRAHADHTGRCYWLPILVVSGYAREVDTAVEAMKDGANDIIRKPFVGHALSDIVRRTLDHCGRSTHDLCRKGFRPASAPSVGESLIITIPGDRVARRTRVMVGARSTQITDSCLRILLRLIVAHEGGSVIHKRDLGATAEQGFKGVSVLREALAPLVDDGVELIKNHYHGNYSLADGVSVGACDIGKLLAIGEKDITDLAQKLRRLLNARSGKV